MFSHKEFNHIIKLMKESGKLCNFIEAKERDEFIILRHDVEFSVDRAFKMASIEKKQEVASTYFFQVTNNSYNLFSKQNMEKVYMIKNMGHEIGLHFHHDGDESLKNLKEKIIKQKQIFELFYEIPIMYFSIHRPTKHMLKMNLKMDGMLNTYDNRFFSYSDDINIQVPLIKYISDARHRWNYSLEPNEKTFMSYKKIQVLIHPYSWTEEGYNNADNFQTLIQENMVQFMDTIENECTHFTNVRHLMEDKKSNAL